MQEQTTEKPKPLSKTQKRHHIPDYEQLFQENASTEKDGKPSGIYKLILKQNRWKMLLSTILGLIKHSPVLVIPLFTAEIINAMVAGGPDAGKKIALYCIILSIFIVQNIPSHILREWYNNSMLRTIEAGLRNTLIRKLQHLSLTYHKELESGKIQAKFLRDIAAIEVLNRQFTNILLPEIVNILVYVVIAASKSWIVTLFFAAVIPVNLLVITFFKKTISNANRTFRKENEEVSAKVSNMIDMIPITKAHGLEHKEINALEQKIRQLREQGLLVDKTNARFGSVSWVISQIMSLLCLIFTVSMAYRGVIEIGDVVMFQSYFNAISNALRGLIAIYPELSKGIESVDSLSEIILSKEIEDNRGKIPLRYVHGTVQFQNVTYRYPKADEPTIKDFSLSVEPGECIAFVGSSGSGKSTLMNMIIGFMYPTEGQLLIDGKPIEMLNLSKYRHFLSVVPQNSVLFTGSIRENITYGMPKISEEQLHNIVHLANIDEFLDQLPNGLDTQVGENGANLSGGQKQRISIARALIRDPKILILDEATSALDNISEYHVQQAINHLTKGRTTFIVAHRLSTIRNADRIVVMDHGRCVEMGTYDELVAKKGAFYQLKSLNDTLSETK